LVGLEGRVLSGMGFTLFNGRATWDRAGKAAAAGTPTFTISGTVTQNGSPLGGVNFTADAGASCSPSNPSGQYGCTMPQGYTGTVTPSLTGYTFTPPSRSYSNVTADSAGQGYAAAAAAGTGNGRGGGAPRARR